MIDGLIEGKDYIMFNGEPYAKFVRKERYDIEYDASEDRNEMHMVRYIIKDGYRLFKVAATYAKQLHPNNYYVICKDKSQARRIFMQTFTWLHVIESVRQCDEDETSNVINNPFHFIIL